MIRTEWEEEKLYLKLMAHEGVIQSSSIKRGIWSEQNGI